MSRCFPYPPPGYVRNGVPGEALIESIKLQKGKEKSKTERSKEKKEKKEKEKKREKKRNEQQSLPGQAGDAKPKKLIDDKSHYGDKCKEDPYLLKGKEDETEQLEKSSLTEEHGQPVNSQASNKRKRSSSPSTSSSSRTHGNILRFRLPSQKQREQEQCSTSGRANCSVESTQQNVAVQGLSFKKLKTDTDIKKDQQCSTSGKVNCSTESTLQNVAIQKPSLKRLRTDTDIKKDQQISASRGVNCSAESAQQNVAVQEPSLKKLKADTNIKKVTPKSGDEIPHSMKGKDKKISEAEAAPKTKSHKQEKHVKRWAKLCSKMDAFVPLPLLHAEQNDCDDQWLFERKPKEQVSKRCGADNDGLCNGSAASWPRAQYLSEADVYALPYTVPF